MSSTRSAPRFVGQLMTSRYKDGGCPLRGRANWLQIGSVRCGPATVALVVTKPIATELFAGADSTRHKVRNWQVEMPGRRNFPFWSRNGSRTDSQPRRYPRAVKLAQRSNSVAH